MRRPIFTLFRSVLIFFLVWSNPLIFIYSISAGAHPTTQGLYNSAKGSPPVQRAPFNLASPFLEIERAWNRTYGSDLYERGYAIIECQSGGFAITGINRQPNTENYDMLLIRTDGSGNQLWNQSYDQSDLDIGRGLVECHDGGLAIIGYTQEKRGSGFDTWLVRTDAEGNLLWNQTYDGFITEGGTAIVKCSIGGFAILGSLSFGTLWLLRVDQQGIPQWNQTFHGGNTGLDKALVECWDGGFAFVGSTREWPPKVQLFRTDVSGTCLWNRTYSCEDQDYGRAIVELGVNGFAILSSSWNSTSQDLDLWLLRTDGIGNLLWNQTYGGPTSELATSLVALRSGGFLLAGIKTTFSYYYHYDAWLGQINRRGELLWNYTCGGLEDDLIFSCVECLLGGVAFTGYTASYGAGVYDVWLLRIPSNIGLVVYNAVIWIGGLMILPISISTIAVWFGLHALRPPQSEFQEPRKKQSRN